MAEAKTKPTGVSVEKHIAALANEEQRSDAQVLVALLRQVTKQEPKMWGPSIIGFGSYHYKYASGHEGDSALAGFAARKHEIAIYIVAGFDGQEDLLAKLGKHKTAKACLYIRRLADIDLKVLEMLVARSVARDEAPLSFARMSAAPDPSIGRTSTGAARDPAPQRLMRGNAQVRSRTSPSRSHLSGV